MAMGYFFSDEDPTARRAEAAKRSERLAAMLAQSGLARNRSEAINQALHGIGMLGYQYGERKAGQAEKAADLKTLELLLGGGTPPITPPQPPLETGGGTPPIVPPASPMAPPQPMAPKMTTLPQQPAPPVYPSKDALPQTPPMGGPQAAAQIQPPAPPQPAPQRAPALTTAGVGGGGLMGNLAWALDPFLKNAGGLGSIEGAVAPEARTALNHVFDPITSRLNGAFNLPQAQASVAPEAPMPGFDIESLSRDLSPKVPLPPSVDQMTPAMPQAPVVPQIQPPTASAPPNVAAGERFVPHMSGQYYMDRETGSPYRGTPPGMPPLGQQQPAASGPAALRGGIQEAANALGVSPVDLATVISYETAGTFDPTKRGPTTKWGQHRGLIQFGEPQARQHGVDWSDPVNSQLGADGAVVKYLKTAGVQPGMGLMDIYSAINAGAPGRYNASDARNGGAPGTVADKVNYQMSDHRRKAMELLAADGSGRPPVVQAQYNGGQPQMNPRRRQVLEYLARNGNASQRRAVISELLKERLKPGPSQADQLDMMKTQYEIENLKNKLRIDSAKFDADRSKERNALDEQRDQKLGYARNVMGSIDDAFEIMNTGLMAGTGWETFMNWIPVTDANKLDKALNTIKSNVGFNRLQEMREASPTGGALGQVSEMENRLLQSTIASMDPSQGVDAMRKNLGRVKKVFFNTIHGKDDQISEALGPRFDEAVAENAARLMNSGLREQDAFDQAFMSTFENWSFR